MKDNSILINTARGELIQNISILINSIKNKKLYGVGLDVLPSRHQIMMIAKLMVGLN